MTKKKISRALLLGLVVLMGVTPAISPIETITDAYAAPKAAVLGIPELESINPNPDDDGDITLTWNVTDDALEYRVYRSNHSFSSTSEEYVVNFRTNYGQFNTYATDWRKTDGTYYYRVVAIDDFYNQALSNEQSVVVDLYVELYLYFPYIQYSW